MSRSSVVIEELTGRKRRIELRGGALPAKGAAFPQMQRVVTTWFPGNGSEATQQVLGPQEGAPSWEGYWSTPVLASEPSLYREGAGGADQRIARASTLTTIFDALTAGGSLLRIEWSQDDDHKMVREGRITEFEPKPRTKDDIDWSITFEWTGRGQGAKRVISTKKDGQLATHKKIENELNKLLAELTASKVFSSSRADLQFADSFTLGDLESFVSGVGNFFGGFADAIDFFAGRVRQIGDLLQSVEELPADIAQQFVDATATLISSCTQFSDQVSRQGPETYARFDQSAGVKTIVNASRLQSSTKKATDAVILACTEARSTLLKKSGILPGSASPDGKPTPAVLTFYTAKQGDTFAGIAKKKLGDPSLGPAVAKASGYAWFDASPRVGDLVVIPTQKSASQLLP